MESNGIVCLASRVEVSLEQIRVTRGAVRWIGRQLLMAPTEEVFAGAAARLGIVPHAWTASRTLLSCACRVPWLVSRRWVLEDLALPLAVTLHLAELSVALVQLWWAKDRAGRVPAALEGVDDALAVLEADGEAVLDCFE